jgi:SpoVK/Ycf46/Vps4 family AAA+-type ATPase
MTAKLLNRLVEAIAVNDNDSLRQIATTIIAEEKKIGHTRLANQLEYVLKESKEASPSGIKNTAGNVITNELVPLPVSRRYNESLATLVPHEKLKRHMVLSSELEERFDQIEKEYAAKERLKKYNLKPQNKILLYGPPGCGKTLGAERLAWNLGLPLMKVKFDAIISSFFGESAANLRAIFEAGMEKACVLLLDECDFIAKSRVTGRDVGEVPRIVNMLLMLLDDYAAPGLVVATTNLENSLDKALFRRFDSVIEITRPGDSEIRSLFDFTLSAFLVAQDINWDVLTENVKGFSAATIVKIAERAAKRSVLEGNSIITQTFLEDAIIENRHDREAV